MKIEMLLLMSAIFNFVMFFSIGFMLTTIMGVQKKTIERQAEAKVYMNKYNLEVTNILNDLFEVVAMHEKDLKVIKASKKGDKKVKKVRAK